MNWVSQISVAFHLLNNAALLAVGTLGYCELRRRLRDRLPSWAQTLLYGALFGALVYMLAADRLAKLSPVYWEFGVGLILVVVVLLCPDGLLGIVDRIKAAFARRAR